MPNFEKPHLPSLDGIRAVAVLLVVESHYLNSPYFPRGASGVLLFFVLSGFLITRLLLGEKASTGTVSLRAFYLRRARRILPALYVVSPSLPLDYCPSIFGRPDATRHFGFRFNPAGLLLFLLFRGDAPAPAQ